MDERDGDRGGPRRDRDVDPEVASYASLARFHAESEKECWRVLEASEGVQFDSEHRKDWIARTRGVLRYHTRMARKYERTARYPWLPVAPDPPEPSQ